MEISKPTYLDVLQARDAGWPALNEAALGRVYNEARVRNSSWCLLAAWRNDRAFGQNRSTYAALVAATASGSTTSTMLLGCYQTTREPWIVCLGLTRASLERLVGQHDMTAFWADPISDQLFAIDAAGGTRMLGPFHAGLIAQNVGERSPRMFLGFDDPLQPWSDELSVPAEVAVPGSRSLKALVKGWFTGLDHRFQNPADIGGVTTGLPMLDRIGGIGPGDVCVLGGEAGVGKTALMLSIAAAATRAGAEGLYISLSETSETICERMLLAQASVRLDRIRAGERRRTDMSSLVSAAATMSALPLTLNDGDGAPMSPVRLRDLVCQWRTGTTSKHAFVVVDYVQLIHGGPGVRSLVNLARECAIALFVVTQGGSDPGTGLFRNLSETAAAALVLGRAPRTRDGYCLTLVRHRRSPPSRHALSFNATAGRFEVARENGPAT
jgi:hypothetical protein